MLGRFMRVFQLFLVQLPGQISCSPVILVTALTTLTCHLPHCPHANEDNQHTVPQLGRLLLQVRFLFPVLPLFNMAAAAAVVRLHRNRQKGPFWAGLWLVAGALLACSAAAAVLMTAVSRLNYPGGHALAGLHAMEAPSAADALSSGDSQRSECSDSWSDYTALLFRTTADQFP